MRFSEATYMGNDYDSMIVEHLFVIDYICRNPEMLQNKSQTLIGLAYSINY